MTDLDHPLSPYGALLGLDAMRIKSQQVIDALERLAADVRYQQINVDSVIAALAPYVTVPDTVFRELIQIPVPIADWKSAQTLVCRMFAADQEKSYDEALHEIFMAGMAAMAHRLIPIDEQEHF